MVALAFCVCQVFPDVWGDYLIFVLIFTYLIACARTLFKDGKQEVVFVT